MQEVKRIFDQLKSTSSTNEKKEILKQNKDNEQFTATLKWLVNSYIVTGISEKKLHKQIDNDKSKMFTTTEWDRIMEFLTLNNTGKDSDIKFVQNFIRCQSEDMKEFYEQLVTKSLKVGVDAKTVNAVYGKDFVPSFSVMLANKYFDRPDKVTGDFTITEKLDGVRCVCIINGDGKISFYSRQGQLITGLIDVENDIKQLKLTNGVIDGELVLANCDEVSSKDNYKETIKIVRKDGEKHGVKYMMFDTIALSEFSCQDCTTPYSKRRKFLDTFGNKEFAQVLPVLYSGSDTDKITEWLSWAKKSNREGVMVNLNSGFYEFKRTNQLLKVKVMQDADLLVMGVYEGTGRNQGRLGGIEVEFIHNGQHYRCNCGGGFSDKERDTYWKQPEMIVGKMATIQYFEITENADGGCGLRFPVWTGRIRDDKNEISLN